MIKDITIGQYYPTNSIVHKLDPRVKIIGTFLFMISLFIINSFRTYIWVLMFLIFSLRLSKIPVRYVLKGLRPLLFILIFTLVINAFMTPGEVIYSIKTVTITKEGLTQGVFMVIRLIFLITGTSLLTLATSPIELTDGIEKLLDPFKKIKVPSHELAMMMTIALRFIPTLLDETDKIMKAQMARGADFESKNFLNRAKSLIPLLVPLFISSFRRADELAMAMEARCYRGGENRTKMKQIKLGKKDYIAFSILALYFIIVIAFQLRW
ncbi:energy-coupling factor transport system permease protein [Alkalithermobacter thermoalcaliphilus JW-YL-7 = DSM 7308]|uniref:Energy-coupling factor transporter transmembrane protein EcfT n=1 Tax=Alkalithermobacter thermoalcaliphilus JW-YL-7 = DSM 7308 TaxID=1121328 RepID=A0A150FN14_CLOPD|nr:ECF transporter transmembrane protein EcfT [[Clostridium] paradoxum JW-YL-7 = DSM 7308]SHL24258.1 energy-coupling factor transport system permease protein [[Clostridium] paradoxum JW-YL-7 = DSM 7308]